MTVVLVGVDHAATVHFAASPLAELISALNVLDDPSHHPHADVVLRATETLPVETFEDLGRYAVLWRAFRCGLLLPTVQAAAQDLATELADLRATPRDAFVEFVVHAIRGGGPISDVRGVGDSPELQRKALAHARARGPKAVELVTHLFADARKVQDDLCDVLATCDCLFFAQMWRELGPALGREARMRNDMLDRFGALSTLVAAIPSAKRGTASDTIVVDKVHDGRMDLQFSTLTLVPTILGRPHTVVKDERDEFAIQYPITDSRERPAPPMGMQRRRLRTLCDPVSLQICRDIAREPRSTLQLAERWKLDTAVVSRHLKELRAAHLVDSERAGHFVLYRLRTDEVAHLGDDLLVLLLR